MTAQIIYPLALVTHITGFTIMAGTTLVDYLLFKQFWKQFVKEKAKGLAISEAISVLPVLFGIGIVLLIISGVTMMAMTNGVFGEQLWFRIKFGLVILIILNGLLVGRKQGSKLRKILSEDTSGENDVRLLKIKRNLNSFHISQMLMFITIFILSVFKFN